MPNVIAIAIANEARPEAKEKNSSPHLGQQHVGDKRVRDHDAAKALRLRGVVALDEARAHAVDVGRGKVSARHTARERGARPAAALEEPQALARHRAGQHGGDFEDLDFFDAVDGLVVVKPVLLSSSSLLSLSLSLSLFVVKYVFG